MGLDLAASWMVGDLISDVLAGLNAGCRSILVGSGQTDGCRTGGHSSAGNFLTAAEILADRGRRSSWTSKRIRPSRNSLMKILLTGGAGYVGSACLRWLLRHGHDPIAYDNLSRGTPRPSPKPRAGSIVGDIAETDRLAEVLERAPDRSRHALCGAGLGPRLDRRPRSVLPGQRPRDQERARRHATRPA